MSKVSNNKNQKIGGANKDQKTPSKKVVLQVKGSKKKYSFLNNFLSVFIILILLTFLFSEVISNEDDDIRLAISEVAELVKTNKVESLVVRGSDVEVLLKTEEGSEGELKETQKDEQASIEETLSIYGVTAEQLLKVLQDFCFGLEFYFQF